MSVKERVDCNIHLTERRIKGVEKGQGPTPGVCFTEVSVTETYEIPHERSIDSSLV